MNHLHGLTTGLSPMLSIQPQLQGVYIAHNLCPFLLIAEKVSNLFEYTLYSRKPRIIFFHLTYELPSWHNYRLSTYVVHKALNTIETYPPMLNC